MIKRYTYDVVPISWSLDPTWNAAGATVLSAQLVLPDGSRRIIVVTLDTGTTVATASYTPAKDDLALVGVYTIDVQLTLTDNSTRRTSHNVTVYPARRS